MPLGSVTLFLAYPVNVSLQPEIMSKYTHSSLFTNWVSSKNKKYITWTLRWMGAPEYFINSKQVSEPYRVMLKELKGGGGGGISSSNENVYGKKRITLKI